MTQDDLRFMPAVQHIAAQLGVRGNGALIVPLSLADETEQKWPGFLAYCQRDGYIRGSLQPATTA